MFSKCLDNLSVILLNQKRAICNHVTNERVNTQGGVRKEKTKAWLWCVHKDIKKGLSLLPFMLLCFL